ncbi:RE2 [Symbiodinium pilosum]|uniref:RE2 protein n=1 Tax=Symbiodinium pilosum TaxID=2952 RepID=A0A812NJW2_SYMPI|nr:RE2 [Symbiodinium pilosum]
MHASSLTAYDEVRQVVVSCLQAKRVWTPNATYAHHGRAKDPDAMDIGKIGDKESPKGKGKGKDKSGKGKKGDKPKGKGDGHQLGEKGKDNKEKEKCPICWRAGHRVQDCWFNSKGKGKGQGKKGGNTVNQVADDNASVLSAGPSASQAGSTASTTKPGLRRISDEHMRVLRIGGGDIRQGHLLVDTGATVSVCRPGTFKAAVDLEQKQKLYSVDDTLLNTQGVTEPVLELGDQNRQTARTTCQVVEGITDDILSVNRAVDAGAKVVFHKPRVYRGNQFLMPYTELKKAKRATIAPVAAEVINVIVDDPEAEAVEEWARREAEREAAAAAAADEDAAVEQRAAEVLNLVDKDTGNVAWAIQKRMGADKVKVREAPPYSHQSQGAVEGLWVGRLERDNSNIILTEAALMATVAGVPWEPRWGRRLREAPLVVVLPNDEHERVYEEDGPPQPPELAHDGPSNRVDIEALPRDARDAGRSRGAMMGDQCGRNRREGAGGGTETAKANEGGTEKEPGNPFAEQRLATVMDYLAFTPMARRSVPRGSKIFRYTWVDKAKGGVYKSRFTCADVKRGYTAEEEQDLKVFVPTPTPEAHSLLEVRAQTGEYVYMRAPPEWRPLYDEWVREISPAQRIPFEDVVFRLDGNLYGRRTAGSVYRDELEEIGPKERSQVPSKKANLENLEPLSAGKAAQYRSAVGSAIYLSADRRDIQFAVKELAPRACDWECAQNLGRYLQTYPDLVRVTTLDPAAYEGPLVLDVFSDSDWGGCAETRRSTDSHVVVLGGAVITTTTQTQPGLPATSSPDAELRGISRACREALFVYELATKNFGLEVQIPRLWSDSSTGITAAKRIGPGSKLRHLEVCEFYVQGAVQAGKMLLRKVKGTENPGNFLTKHAKTGKEVQEALPSLGMVDLKTDEEEQVEPAEAPALQVRAPPLRDHRPPAPEPEPVDQEQVPQQAAAAAAAPPEPPQGGMRQRNRGARQIPVREQGAMYYAPTRRTAHIFRNCSGLAPVPDAEIRGVQICPYCQENWPAGVPMTRELRHVWAQYDAYRTPHLVDHCFVVRYRATTELPVCRHCRDGHIQTDP